MFQTVQDRLDAEEIDPNQLTIEDAEARAAFEVAEPKQEPEEPVEGEEPEITDDGLPFAEAETVTDTKPDDDIPEATAELILGPEI